MLGLKLIDFSKRGPWSPTLYFNTAALLLTPISIYVHFMVNLCIYHTNFNPDFIFYVDYPNDMHTISDASLLWLHNDVIQWIDFPRYWTVVRGIHRSPVNFPHKRGVLTFSLICAWINGWVNIREATYLYSSWLFHRHRSNKTIAPEQEIKTCGSLAKLAAT